MSELRPCPFCGGEAELKKYYPPFNRRAIVTVKCKSCRCNSGEWKRSDKAIESWNTRADAEIRAKAIDEFEKEIEAEYDNDACPNVTDYLDYKISLRDLFRIAEELKGE